VAVGEKSPVTDQRIEIGSIDLAAKGVDVRVAHVVGDEQKDVGLLVLLAMVIAAVLLGPIIVTLIPVVVPALVSVVPSAMSLAVGLAGILFARQACRRCRRLRWGRRITVAFGVPGVARICPPCRSSWSHCL
jgi:hypothetical protein